MSRPTLDCRNKKFTESKLHEKMIKELITQCQRVARGNFFCNLCLPPSPKKSDSKEKSHFVILLYKVIKRILRILPPHPGKKIFSLYPSLKILILMLPLHWRATTKFSIKTSSLLICCKISKSTVLKPFLYQLKIFK